MGTPLPETAFRRQKHEVEPVELESTPFIAEGDYETASPGYRVARLGALCLATTASCVWGARDSARGGFPRARSHTRTECAKRRQAGGVPGIIPSNKNIKPNRRCETIPAQFRSLETPSGVDGYL
jgi:hypothetical protein